MKVPFFEFRFDREVKEELNIAFNKVLESGSFIQGEEVEKLEEDLARFLGVKHVICVGSGYDALYLSLKALTKGDKKNVLLQGNAYHATINAVINSGNNPVFYDIDYENNHLANGFEEWAVKNKIDIVLPIHYFGNIQKIDKSQIGEINLLEDFSQAFGSKKNGWTGGTEGLINAASLYPTKNLGALGDAGIISTNNSKLSELCRELKNYGESSYYKLEHIGINSRMDEYQAAFTSVFLNRFDEIKSKKIELYKRYNEELNGIPELNTPKFNEGEIPYIYVVKSAKRAELEDFLSDHGVLTKRHYPISILDQKVYESWANSYFSKLEQTNKWHEDVLSLPFFIGMTEVEQEYVIRMVEKFFN